MIVWGVVFRRLVVQRLIKVSERGCVCFDKRPARVCGLVTNAKIKTEGFYDSFIPSIYI